MYNNLQQMQTVSFLNITKTLFTKAHFAEVHKPPDPILQKKKKFLVVTKSTCAPHP